MRRNTSLNLLWSPTPEPRTWGTWCSLFRAQVPKIMRRVLRLALPPGCLCAPCRYSVNALYKIHWPSDLALPLIQVQLWFCPQDPSAEQCDEFPPSICVQINSKMCPLPNPIPTNKLNVEPKRPPRQDLITLEKIATSFRPINITQLCKLSTILANTVNVKWAADYGENWATTIVHCFYTSFCRKRVGIWLVEKLSSGHWAGATKGYMESLVSVKCFEWQTLLRASIYAIWFNQGFIKHFLGQMLSRTNTNAPNTI